MKARIIGKVAFLQDRRQADIMINLFRRKPKEENPESIQKELDAITKRSYQENQKRIDKYYKERR